MKTILTLVLALSLSSAFASTTPMVAKAILPETGSTVGTFGSEAPPANDSVMKTDTINSNQSSTVRSAPSRKKATLAKCTDRSGKVYSSVQSGYAACKNEMNR